MALKTHTLFTERIIMAAARKTATARKLSMKEAPVPSGKKMQQKTQVKPVAKSTGKASVKPVKKAMSKGKATPKIAVKTIAPTKAKVMKKMPAAKKPANMSGPGEGDKALAFVLPGLEGNVSLAGLKGKKVVLYFYPKDDTSGCTKEACDFQESMPRFKKGDAVIIGISKDSVASHQKFARKYGLTFNLAADEDTKTASAYGVWIEKSMYGRKYMGMDRATFLIDGKGIIRKVWRNVKVPGHVAEVMKALAEI
jgi:peroxiredoxin Q/BCP